MKRILAVILLLSLLCGVLVGCAEMPSTTKTETTPVWTEPAPVQTEPISVTESVCKVTPQFTRLSEEPINELKPSEDYGCILPFCGSAPDFDSGDLLYANYGFVDASGRIVVDPVYQYVYTLEVEEGYAFEPCVWMMAQGEVKQVPQMVGYYYIEDRLCGMATSDGTVVIDMVYDSIWVVGNHIFAWKEGSEIPGMDIYNFNCELVGWVPDTPYYIMGFSEGILRVRRDWEEYYYMDLSGNILAGPFVEAEDFSCGYGLVQMKTEHGTKYNYVGKDGKFLSEDGWLFTPKEGEPYQIVGFDYAESFVNGVACVQVLHMQKQYNVLTTENEFLFAFKGSKPYDCTEDAILYTAWGSTEVYDHSGELLWSHAQELQQMSGDGASLLYDATGNRFFNWKTGGVFAGFDETVAVGLTNYEDFPYYIFSNEKEWKCIATDEKMNILCQMDSGFEILRDAVTGNYCFMDHGERGQRVIFPHSGDIAEGCGGIEFFVYNDMIMTLDRDACRYYNSDNELVFCYPYATE